MVYDAIFELLDKEKHSSNLIKDVKKVSDDKILIDCNASRCATLKIKGETVYIDADERTKQEVKKVLDRLLKRR